METVIERTFHFVSRPDFPAPTDGGSVTIRAMLDNSGSVEVIPHDCWPWIEPASLGLIQDAVAQTVHARELYMSAHRADVDAKILTEVADAL